MTDKQYHDFVNLHKSSFRIVWAPDMKKKKPEATDDTAPSSSSSSLDHNSPLLPIPESQDTMQETRTLHSWPSDDTFDSPSASAGLARTGASQDIVMDG